MNRLFHAVQWILVPVASALILAGTGTGAVQAMDCDRACLQNMITRYPDAMVAHDLSQLPAASKVRFTEDSRKIRIGEGLWKTVTRDGDFRQDYIDVKRQIAASQVLYSDVLHVPKPKIGGIETLVYRVPADAKLKPDHLDKPLAGMSEPAPTGKRMPRAEMVRIALSYTEGL